MEADLGPNLTLVMNNPDFTTVQRLARSINEKTGCQTARAIDLSPSAGGAAVVPGPPGWISVSFIEGVDVVPDNKARVVVNERPGRWSGRRGRISPVAVAHGNLRVWGRRSPWSLSRIPVPRG
jgi:flagellar P-ring protein precursor FlgI